MQELEAELRRLLSRNDKISATTLAIATAQLNSRIRTNGMSSREMWLNRDQFTNDQLPLHDKMIIASQHDRRTSNHGPSELSEAHGRPRATDQAVQPGDIV